MTCQITRAEYIQTVSDLCEMTRHLTEMQKEYVEAVRDGDDLRRIDVRRRWDLYKAGITRLIAEEDVSFRAYDHARDHH